MGSVTYPTQSLPKPSLRTFIIVKLAKHVIQDTKSCKSPKTYLPELMSSRNCMHIKYLGNSCKRKTKNLQKPEIHTMYLLYKESVRCTTYNAICQEKLPGYHKSTGPFSTHTFIYLGLCVLHRFQQKLKGRYH